MPLGNHFLGLPSHTDLFQQKSYYPNIVTHSEDELTILPKIITSWNASSISLATLCKPFRRSPAAIAVIIFSWRTPPPSHHPIVMYYRIATAYLPFVCVCLLLLLGFCTLDDSSIRAPPPFVRVSIVVEYRSRVAHPFRATAPPSPSRSTAQ